MTLHLLYEPKNQSLRGKEGTGYGDRYIRKQVMDRSPKELRRLTKLKQSQKQPQQPHPHIIRSLPLPIPLHPNLTRSTRERNSKSAQHSAIIPWNTHSLKCDPSFLPSFHFIALHTDNSPRGLVPPSSTISSLSTHTTHSHHKCTQNATFPSSILHLYAVVGFVNFVS